MIAVALPIPAHTRAAASQNVFAALRWQKASLQGLSQVEKASAFWRMTPDAIAQVCMASDGFGSLLGDDIFKDKDNPSMLGLPPEVIRAAPNKE